jgi:hypothetical protein
MVLWSMYSAGIVMLLKYSKLWDPSIVRSMWKRDDDNSNTCEKSWLTEECPTQYFMKIT